MVKIQFLFAIWNSPLDPVVLKTHSYLGKEEAEENI